jgi:hypothetical protein
MSTSSNRATSHARYEAGNEKIAQLLNKNDYEHAQNTLFISPLVVARLFVQRFTSTAPPILATVAAAVSAMTEPPASPIFPRFDQDHNMLEAIV